MSSARPIAGFRSVTDAVHHHTIRGLKPKEIAETLGITINQVYTSQSYHRRRTGKDKPKVAIPDEVFAGLKNEAYKRKVPWEVLAQSLLKNIVRDQLFNAVLEE